MKSLVFDSSSIISIVTNNLLDILTDLIKRFNGNFYITKDVKREIIDAPLKGKKFKFEALILADYLADGYFKFLKNVKLDNKTNRLLKIANNIFLINGNPLEILHKAEVESLVLALTLKSDAYVVDERNMRLLIEDPRKLGKLLERKFQTKIEIDKRNFRLFLDQVQDINIIRTTELMTIAFELGLFNKYENSKEFIKGNVKKEILEGVLWGLKLRGCSISNYEIEDILKLERFK